MDNQIWKFPLETIDIQEIEMPSSFEVLTIQTQSGIPCIWAMVNPDAPKVKVKFEIFGTGHPFKQNGNRKYIGTYQLHNGALVFHCFQLLR